MFKCSKIKNYLKILFNEIKLLIGPALGDVDGSSVSAWDLFVKKYFFGMDVNTGNYFETMVEKRCNHQNY